MIKTLILFALVNFAHLSSVNAEEACQLALEKPTAGIDYPTDITPPKWAKNSKVLVLGKNHRMPIAIEKAVAGIDYPTDGPPNSKRDFYVAVTFNGARIALVNE